jgi:hypothetical protein
LLYLREGKKFSISLPFHFIASHIRKKELCCAAHYKNGEQRKEEGGKKAAK